MEKTSENLSSPEKKPLVPGGRELVFYDGTCGLCHETVKFVLARDRDGGRFGFAPLQGETAAQLLARDGGEALPDSIVVRQTDGELLFRSDAIFHILDRLGGVWRAVAKVGMMLPKGLRDRAYDLVARVRRRIFKQPDGYCPMLPDEIRERFLP